MKVVVLDEYTEDPGNLSQKGLENLGELTVYDRTPEEQVVECTSRAEAMYTDRTSISAQAVKSCPNLRFIEMLATGCNIVDIHAAGEAGVMAFSIPSYDADAVAQYVIALLLELYHHASFHADRIKAGEWTHCKDWYFWKCPLTGLAGKAMGIIGFGYIGRCTAVITEALDMKVLAYDRCQDKNLETDNCRHVGLEELPVCSDAINLHCPLFPEAEKIISRQTIAGMKRGVLIINTFKRKLVGEAGLREGLGSGKIGGAAVDVISTKSIQEDNPFLGAKDILITPHVAWAPRESRRRLMDIMVENLIQFMAGMPQHAMNKP